jgi:DNA-binding protein HU-beta
MTKADLVAKIAEKAGITKANAERALNAFPRGLEASLVGEGKLTLTGFGTFEVLDARPAPGAIPARARRSRFRPSKVGQVPRRQAAQGRREVTGGALR